MGGGSCVSLPASSWLSIPPAAHSAAEACEKVPFQTIMFLNCRVCWLRKHFEIERCRSRRTWSTLYRCWIIKGVTYIETIRALQRPSVPRHGTAWRLALLPVGLCPSALHLQGRQDGDGEEKKLSPVCLRCLRARPRGLSVPQPVRVLEASLQIARAETCEAYGSLALLRRPLPEAVCLANTGSELLMNSGFHLLSVVLNCFCT